MSIHYLEIVTSELDALCAAYESAQGLEFSEPVPELGGARVAKLPEGGRVGIRAPLRDTESPVVRPYWLVDDVAKALSAAKNAGAEIAMPEMEIPGQGAFGIYLLGGTEHGVWKRP